jgi:HSP20 family protein
MELIMTLIKWKPTNDVATFNIDNFFNTDEWGFSSSSDYEWSPPLDIEAFQNLYKIKMDIPGLTKKDIKITLFDNVLEISGSRKKTNISDNNYYKYNERLTGSFKRRFNIKNLINDNKITATSKSGLLEITLPKMEKDTPKEKNIKIN